MSQRRFRIKSKTSIIVFVVYLLISGLFLGFSAGGFIVNFKELGFSIISGVEKGIHSVTNGVSTFFTAIGDLADLRVEYEKLQAKLEDYTLRRRMNRPNLTAIPNDQIYELIGVTRNNQVTLAATMLFSPYPQAYFPQLGIIATCVPGTEMGVLNEYY